ncbi:skin secretory protein xP2-like [Iris pallida]|uniref:Skin secretory protein xP2-like n=2 Tax=Iris pallida TaxID=29817 RepID=A0AAX6F8C3_IRIPA|nr:skin secretory protein xP2-like [Iris pallida]
MSQTFPPIPRHGTYPCQWRAVPRPHSAAPPNRSRVTAAPMISSVPDLRLSTVRVLHRPPLEPESSERTRRHTDAS